MQIGARLFNLEYQLKRLEGATIGYQIVSLLIFSLIARIFVSGLFLELGFKYDPILFLRSDVFADSIKSSLAINSIYAALSSAASVNTWPPVFQNYLLHNEYLNPSSGITINHTLPFMMIILLIIGKLIVLIGPILTLFLLFFAFFICSFSIIYSASRAFNLDSNLASQLFFVLIFSFPTIFMIDRANYNSGFTSLSLIAYVFLVALNRLPILRAVLLALAINMRPNTIIFAILELNVIPHYKCIVKVYIKTFIIGVCLAWFSFVFIVYTEGNYSIETISKGLKLYNDNYITGNYSISWGTSLLGFIKSFRKIANYQGSVSSFFSIITYFIAALMLALTSLLFFLKRLGRLESIFLACALTSLFTPVYASYHLLVYFAPMAVGMIYLHASLGKNLPNIPIFPILLLIGCCIIVWSFPSFYSALILIILSALTPVFYYIWSEANFNEQGLCVLIIISSAIPLCYLGGEITNNLIVAPVIITTSILIVWHIIKHPSYRIIPAKEL